MNTTTDRSVVIRRALDLRELASSTNSQAEAMAAMKIADKLMRSYALDEAELVLAEADGTWTPEIIRERRGNIGLNVGRNRHKVQVSLWAIENYCGVECVLHSGSYNGSSSLTVIGDRPDVDMFYYLLALVRGSMDASYNAWKKTQNGIGRGAKASFQLGFAYAVNKRLQDMKFDADTQHAADMAEAARALSVDQDTLRDDMRSGDLTQLTSTALVMTGIVEQKRKAVADAYHAAYGNTKLGTASGFGFGTGSASASQAGRSAGNALGLNRPVGASASQPRLS